MSNVHAPANIIITQKTHRQLKELSTMLWASMNFKTIKEKDIPTYYPATMGPMTGPINTLAVKRLVASPRVSADQMSAMTPETADDQQTKYIQEEVDLPPQFVIGATAKNPERNLVTSSVSMFFASACPR